MARLHTIIPAEATGQAAQLFTAIKGAVGMVPNAYATVGSNSPIALEAALKLDAALGRSSLSKQQVEVVKLAVSAHAECDYCLAAHTLMGKHAGLSSDEIIAIRTGAPSGDPSIDALASFAKRLVGSGGTVPEAMVAAVREAGYTDAQIVDTLLAISAITFTNLVNRVNDTVIDFPPAD